MNEQRVLITGAAGFIGSWVTRLAAEDGARVWSVVRPGEPRTRLAGAAGTLVESDVSSAGFLDLVGEIRPAICLHFAWYSEPGRYLSAVRENQEALAAGLRLVEVLGRSGCERMLVAGSCAEYGRPAPGAILTEESHLEPRSPYGRAKVALFEGAQASARTMGLGLAWARIFFLHGPGENPRRIVPSVARAALQGTPFSATGGEQVRDYLHVADVARALWMIASSDMTGPVNVCSGEGVTLRRVLESVESAAGAPGTVRFGECPYGPDEWMFMRGTNTRLRTLGWAPRFELDEGVLNTVEWWRSLMSRAPVEAL